MDAKNPQKLDPKLKEIYERVMGTQLQAAGAATPPANPTPQAPVTPPQVAPAPPSTAPQPATPPATPVASTQAPPVTQFVAGKTENKKADPNHPQSFSDKKSGNSKLMIFVVLGLLFFLTYALFWVRFFGLSLPFLPQ